MNKVAVNCVISAVNRGFPVRLVIQIVLIAAFFLLIIFAIITDLPMGQRLPSLLNLGIYLKLISLFGMVTLALFAWGRKRQIETSQKYRRADEVLAQAEAAFERKRQLCDQMEQRLKAPLANRGQETGVQIDEVRAEFQQRLEGLKQQNLELKETVAKLMGIVKKRKQG